MPNGARRQWTVPACNRRFDSPHIESAYGPFDHLVAAKGFKILACGNGHTARYPHHSQFRSRRPRPLPRLSLHRRRQPQQFLRLTSPRLPRHCLRGSAPRSGRRVRHIGLCLAYRPSPARRLLCVTPREPTAQMHGDVLVTIDSGGSWLGTALPPGTKGLTGISCPSISTCYATDESGMLSTTDSGSTWNRVALPSIAAGPSDLACPSSTTCYVLGSSVIPSALVTTDSGSKRRDGKLPAT